MTDLLIVLNKDEDTVSFINEQDHQTLSIVPVERSPHEVAITPDGRKAYVSNAGANSVFCFDLRTLKISAVIRHPEFQFPHEGKVAPNGKLYLASTYANKVFVIDTATEQVVNVIPARRMSHMVALSPDGGRAYVSNIGDNSLSVLDTETDEWLAHIPVGRQPEGVDVSPDGRWIYVANQDDGTVYVLDGERHSLHARISLDRVPIRVAFCPDGRYAFVPNRERALYHRRRDAPRDQAHSGGPLAGRDGVQRRR
jgi:YVTN family beta-propeller protein